MNYFNKKGISPLIATVLIIGFTIVIAALVITWGTKLFKDTVSQTESTSKFSLVCTTGLKLDVTRVNPINPAITGSPVALRIRSGNQDREGEINKFRFVVYSQNNAVVDVQDVGNVATTDNVYGVLVNAAWSSNVNDSRLSFAVPKTYGIRTNLQGTLTKDFIYIFNYINYSILIRNNLLL